MRRAVFGLAIGLAACRREAPLPPAPAPLPSATIASPPAPTPPPPPAVATDWCLPGLSGLDEDVCYVLPPLAEGKPRRLLVYLHGIVPPLPTSPQKEAVEHAVLGAAEHAGAAALVPRGMKGVGPTGARDWYAWPTDPTSHAQYAKTLVMRWAEAKKKLETIAGAPFERTYLAGSSNGAYFLTALALRGDTDAFGFPIDGFGAMSGGASGGRSPTGRAHALYIGFGTYDDEVKKGARELGAVAAAAHWPVKLAEHPFGHGARQVYLDQAFDFWDSQKE